MRLLLHDPRLLAALVDLVTLAVIRALTEEDNDEGSSQTL